MKVTPEFDCDLRLLMDQRGFANKSDAIRTAVREAAERGSAAARFDFRSLLGIGLRAPLRRQHHELREEGFWS